MIIYACAAGDFIYASNDLGKSWSTLAGAGKRNWTCIASSLDGRTIAAGADNDIYLSTDGGSSWAGANIKSSIAGITSSEDGKRLAAVCRSGTAILVITY